MASLEFPLQFKRQYAAPLDIDAVFLSTQERMEYLAKPVCFAGHICVDLETEQAFIVKADKSGYKPIGEVSKADLENHHHDDAYLKLSGGSLTGTLFSPQLVVGTKNSPYNSGDLEFVKDNSTYSKTVKLLFSQDTKWGRRIEVGDFGYRFYGGLVSSESFGPIYSGNIFVKENSYDEWGKVWHSGNLNPDAIKGSDGTDHNHDLLYEKLLNKGAANGYAGLDSNAKLPIGLIPDALIGQVQYQSSYNAADNLPALSSPPAPQSKGHYYVVSKGGTQFGIAFGVGDWIISSGTEWQKIDNTDAVVSVHGRIGAVVANAGDYSAYQITHGNSNVGSVLDGLNKANWDTAYSWGSHHTAGYFKPGDYTVWHSGNLNPATTSELNAHTANTSIHKDWGSWSTNGARDFRAHGKRAFVAFDTADGNNLAINYGMDFLNGVTLYGKTNVSGELHIAGGTKLENAAANRLKVTTAYGNVEIGPNNADWCHFHTDRGKFWFAKNIHVSGEIYAGPSYSNKVWHSGNQGNGSGLEADTAHKVERFSATGASEGFHKFAMGQNGTQLSSYYCVFQHTDGAWYNIRAGYADDADTLDGLHASSFLRRDTGGMISGNLSITGRLSFDSSIEQSSANVNMNFIRRNSTSPAVYIENFGTGYLASFRASGFQKAFIANDGTMYSPSFAQTSDIRKKENLRPIQGASEKLRQLSTFYHTWKGDISGKEQIGISAQQLNEFYPEAVRYDDKEDKYWVTYSSLIPVLIAADREKQEQLESIKERLIRLETPGESERTNN